ncbi:unnamed protein product [Fusarium graminearum]|nr:unnamed protein product [Fusarium graminearum]
MARYPKKSKAKKGKPKCTLNKKICRKYSKETLEVLIQPDATEKFGMPENYKVLIPSSPSLYNYLESIYLQVHSFISAQSSPVQPQLDHCRYVNFTKPLIIDTVSLPKDTSSSFIEKDRGNATWHTLLSAPGTISNSFTSGIATCPRNGALALHRHTQAEIYYILSGSGEVEVEGVRHSVSKGNLVWIPGDAEHGVFCGDDELKWLYIFPESSFDNIVYRFSSEMENAVKKIKSKL